MIPWLRGGEGFPASDRALAEPNGLLAAGGDLSIPRLLAAYRRGIFPWFNEGEPILWWTPDPRMVLFPSEFRISRSLKKRLARADYEVRADTAFARVMEACAMPRAGAGGTWITLPMRAAYGALHEAGYAHSIETWMAGEDGPELAGGLYGVALGRAFFGESMFTRKTDASKIALAHLVRHLASRGFDVIDCQMRTAHLASLGAREIPRREFTSLLDRLTAEPVPPGKWTLEFRS
ncbi:MAG TPA: leucyl/phenylalanyl-tRNA--protein transferase [Thiobacillaceae bacterium]|nr:leucyl/phenylalanyl-tRNA--protein transferase [Thiobacillaceae bacterium]HNA82414.1 leucyl/phenylalanyl-tRNA--protein transferase [Thiobacillaceae bacterium]HNF88863.1 leucyl/phenylalanyl-tRNA--protein transferase [Thiobacillaceae bacterium]HNH89195.1 leucyl/phenylalanyl-tRNA--protein transferase [Thiobacillaceae bacterium]HNI07344.1 leucyl/phenylalanyl-tRNA--protein transferase [Thiobacillaceae bacterium]